MEFSNKVKEFLVNAIIKEIKIGCSNTHVYEVIKKDKIYFLKIGKKGILSEEYNRLLKLQNIIPVPKIVLFESLEYDEIITEKVEGSMVCSKYYLKNPKNAIKIIKDAFNTLYNVDISNINIDESLSHKLEVAKYNLDNKLITNDDLSLTVKEKFGDVYKVLEYLEKNKWEEEFVLSHGDISLPNIFSKNGKFVGFIDVGDFGIADKWFDIAIMIRSIKRNFGQEYVTYFLDAINVKYDDFKYNYYMLLMELYL